MDMIVTVRKNFAHRDRVHECLASCEAPRVNHSG
jgi:hypothetical protein